MTRLNCPNCGSGIPEGDRICPDCDWDLQSSSRATVLQQSSLQASMRQSLVERFSVRDDGPHQGAMIRPAATVYGGLGIVSALDISSSMTDDRKIEAASEARKDFASGLAGLDEVAAKVRFGSVVFNENARVEFGLEPVTTAAKRLRLLRAKDIGGATDIAGALQLAGRELANGQPADVRGRFYQVILLISDGMQSDSTDPRDIAQRLKRDQRMLRITCVAVGNDADRATLRACASPGLFFEVADGFELKDLYQSFQTAVSSSVVEGGDPATYVSRI